MRQFVDGRHYQKGHAVVRSDWFRLSAWLALELGVLAAITSVVGPGYMFCGGMLVGVTLLGYVNWWLTTWSRRHSKTEWPRRVGRRDR